MRKKVLWLCIGWLVGVLTILKILDWNGTFLRAADRSCHPGMAKELIGDSKVVCVGGQGELWMVNR
jgi:hypothetical protein